MPRTDNVRAGTAQSRRARTRTTIELAPLPVCRTDPCPSTEEVTLPSDLEEALSKEPPWSSRKQGAEILKRLLGYEISHRTLEAKRLPTRHVNNRAQNPTRDLVLMAYRDINAAPIVMGGRADRPFRNSNPSAEQHAEARSTNSPTIDRSVPKTAVLSGSG